MERTLLAYLTSGWGHEALSQACLCQRPWSGSPATPQCLTDPLMKTLGHLSIRALCCPAVVTPSRGILDTGMEQA